MYYLLLPTLQARTAMIAHLKSHGILAVFHYLPLHLSQMGRKFGGKEGDCPVTEDVSDRLIRLPFFNELGETQQEQVIAAVQHFRK
jgi:dTDP-4-amino-4,6-dideoxygalactose transaminase